MAKKAVKKAEAKEREVIQEDIQILHGICLTITARLDRIVAALSTAKRITKDM